MILVSLYRKLGVMVGKKVRMAGRIWRDQVKVNLTGEGEE